MVRRTGCYETYQVLFELCRTSGTTSETCPFYTLDKRYTRSESSQKANLMWVLFQVDSTSDRVWDQVVDRVAMLILPCHPSCFLGFFFALGSASVDGLDDGVALARLEDDGA